MEETKKNTNKKIIIVIITILLALALLIGGFFVYKNLSDNNNIKENESSKNNQVNEEKKEEQLTPLMYEVTKEGSETKLYLFGSIHMADNRAYPLPEKVLNAFETSEYLAVEFDIIAASSNLEEQLEMVQKMLCEPNKTLKDYLHEDTYEMTIKYLKDNNMYNEAYEMYRPVMIYSLISNILGEKSKLTTTKGIDNYFLKQAKSKNKSILEIESQTFQTDLLTEFPDELFDLIIKSTILSEETQIEGLKQLYEGWLTGNPNLLNQDSDEIDEEELKVFLESYPNALKYVEEYNNKLINERNNTMIEKVEGYFKENKNVFVVVGAGHIVGESGLANQMKELGYTVNSIEY